MMKKQMIQAVAAGLFAVLLAFNVTTTINSTTDANVDVSLSGIEAMAQGNGEDGTSAEASCETPCINSCSISGYYQTGCSTTKCDHCKCIGYDEHGNSKEEVVKDCDPIAE